MSPLDFGPPYTPRELARLHDQARRQAGVLRQQAIDQTWRQTAHGLRQAGRRVARGLHALWPLRRRAPGAATPCTRPVLEA